MENEPEFTGVLTRSGEKIYVGQKVETVQGTIFDVIKLEDKCGVKYALHDGNRPYDLENYMSPNLWLVDNCTPTCRICGMRMQSLPDDTFYCEYCENW